jgi:hypothetical protein
MQIKSKDIIKITIGSIMVFGSIWLFPFLAHILPQYLFPGCFGTMIILVLCGGILAGITIIDLIYSKE